MSSWAFIQCKFTTSILAKSYLRVLCTSYFNCHWVAWKINLLSEFSWICKLLFVFNTTITNHLPLQIWLLQKSVISWWSRIIFYSRIFWFWLSWLNIFLFFHWNLIDKYTYLIDKIIIHTSISPFLISFPSYACVIILGECFFLRH